MEASRLYHRVTGGATFRVGVEPAANRASWCVVSRLCCSRIPTVSPPLALGPVLHLEWTTHRVADSPLSPRLHGGGPSRRSLGPPSPIRAYS